MIVKPCRPRSPPSGLQGSVPGTERSVGGNIAAAPPPRSALPVKSTIHVPASRVARCGRPKAQSRGRATPRRCPAPVRWRWRGWPALPIPIHHRVPLSHGVADGQSVIPRRAGRYGECGPCSIVDRSIQQTAKLAARPSNTYDKPLGRRPFRAGTEDRARPPWT